MKFNSGLAESEMRPRRSWSSNPTINIPRGQAKLAVHLKSGTPT